MDLPLEPRVVRQQSCAAPNLPPLLPVIPGSHPADGRRRMLLAADWGLPLREHCLLALFLVLALAWVDAWRRSASSAASSLHHLASKLQVSWICPFHWRPLQVNASLSYFLPANACPMPKAPWSPV